MAGLGELERAVMDHLWSTSEPQTVRQVHEALAERRELAYTTVMTVLQRLAMYSAVETSKLQHCCPQPLGKLLLDGSQLGAPMLSWVGTGRLIFSLNYSDADFEAVAERFAAAARAMRDDGWWHEDAQLTDKKIKRQILKETLGKKIAG